MIIVERKVIMRKFLLSLVAALSLGGAAYAVTGQPPIPATGPGLVDGTWLRALAGGMNQSFMTAPAALGTTQATAFVVPSGMSLMAFATVPSGTGASLPPALPGSCLIVFNHDAANSLTVYPSVRNNPVTGTQDTFQGTTPASTSTITHGISVRFCSVTAGFWN
jgi:hypothetical protein